MHPKRLFNSQVMHAARFRAILLGFVVSAGTGQLWAQEAGSAAVRSPVSNPIVEGVGGTKPVQTKPTLERPRRNRAISPEVAAQLAARAPKFEALPPPAPKESEPEDLREIDKPANDIIRLPKYIVMEKKPAVLRERDILTEKGVQDLAMRKYINEFDRALNAFTLPILGSPREAWAAAMYREDQRLKDMKEMNDLVRMVRATDGAAGKKAERQVQETFLREPNFRR